MLHRCTVFPKSGRLEPLLRTENGRVVVHVRSAGAPHGEWRDVQSLYYSTGTRCDITIV